MGISKGTDGYQSMKKVEQVAMKIAKIVAQYSVRQVGHKLKMKYKTWQQKKTINGRWPLKQVPLYWQLYVAKVCKPQI